MENTHWLSMLITLGEWDWSRETGGRGGRAGTVILVLSVVSDLASVPPCTRHPVLHFVQCL